jgi:GH24 family phage-related lysozyme (muramidase)
MSLKLADIKRHLVPYEGNVSHLYLDTAGKVTVGIGNLLPTAAAAKVLGFVHRITNAPATVAEIQTDFDSVSKQAGARPAAYYRRFTSLDLPPLDIDKLFAVRVAEFQSQLLTSYPRWDGYPPSAQLALLDMAFNLGTFALKNRWPNLNRAIDAQDWAQAANHCIRPQSHAARNDATVALFRKAADQQDLVS